MIPAFVLAGGDSMRFGENKALYTLKGKPMIEHLLNLLIPLSSETFIISKEEEGFTGLGVPVLRDDLNQQTPLAGILRGLKELDSWGLFLACDLPYMEAEVLIKLLNSLNNNPEKEEISAVVASVHENILQPIVACYHISGISSLTAAIEKNYSMKRWLSESKIKVVNFENRKPFKNINEKSDLESPER